LAEFNPTPFDVVVVSIFGRGHWIAVELARIGLNVTLLDLSENLRRWSPDDNEGPWGLFQPERYGTGLMERLNHDDELISVANGFTFWLKSGPLELKGPTTTIRLEKLGFNKIEELDKKPIVSDFKRRWLWNFAFQWMSNEFYENTESEKGRYFAPIGTNFYIRKPTRQGHSKSVDWCERNNVKVIRNLQVQDLAFKSKSDLKSIEVLLEKNPTSEMISADYFVWHLTSEETELLDSKVKQKVFSNGSLEPLWVWQRYRIKIKNAAPEVEQWPEHFIIILDEELTWVHENQLVVKRTTSADTFDLWILMPNVQRFNRDYIMYRSEKIKEALNKKAKQIEFDFIDYPVGMTFTYNHVGPARHMVYDPEQKKKWSPSKLKNVFFESAEVRGTLGFEGEWLEQQKITTSFKKIWQDELIRQKKLFDKNQDKNNGANIGQQENP
jgi:hypothetical protein